MYKQIIPLDMVNLQHTFADCIVYLGIIIYNVTWYVNNDISLLFVGIYIISIQNNSYIILLSVFYYKQQSLNHSLTTSIIYYRFM